MLGLRLVRRAHPLVLLCCVLLACAAAVAGAQLLEALARAAQAPPGHSGRAVPRLLWSVVPLAATAQLGAAVARAVPGEQTRTGLAAGGLGPAGLPLTTGVTAGVCCLAGSAAAALFHLWHGGAVRLTDGGREVPLPAALTLLCVAPLMVAAAAAWASAHRPARAREPYAPTDTPTPTGRAGAGLVPPPDSPSGTSLRTAMSVEEPSRATPLWGAALGLTGLAVTAYAASSGVPAGPEPWGTAGILAGWLILACGVVVAVPGVLYACGKGIAAGKPGALRLLSGRALQQEAHRAGRPLGVLCAVSAAVVVAVRLHHAGLPDVTPGPLTVAGLLLVPVCSAVSALAAIAVWQSERTPVAALLYRLGAPHRLLRRAAALRTAALLAALVPLVWLVSGLAALPVLRSAGG